MPSDIDSKLEIIIPTYNRCKTLEQTLLKILDSPVKNCKITILDNNSNDATSDIVNKFLSEYNNITYVKNRYNIGLAGNMTKALTLVEKEYFWIVFDDTGLDFTNWSYIEKGIEQNYDCVLTLNYYNALNTTDVKEKAAIYLMLIYCFAGIYKSNLINDDVILYSVTDIYPVHSQMALLSALFNDENRKIYIPEKTISYPKINPETEKGEKYSFNRDEGRFYHFRISEGDFIPGFLCGVQSIKDYSLQKACVELLFENRNNYGPYLVKEMLIKKYRHLQKTKDYYVNYLDEMWFLQYKYKIVNFSCLKIRKVIHIENNENNIVIKLFNRFVIKLHKRRR